MQNDWMPISTAPADVRVDVFYKNDTFTPPVCGVLHAAHRKAGFWCGSDGEIPECYVVSWSDKSAPAARRPQSVLTGRSSAAA